MSKLTHHLRHTFVMASLSTMLIAPTLTHAANNDDNGRPPESRYDQSGARDNNANRPPPRDNDANRPPPRDNDTNRPPPRDGRRPMMDPKDMKPYSEAEIRALAQAHALRMAGPGARAEVKAGPQPQSWLVTIIDPKGNRLREEPLNAYGMPLNGRHERGEDRDGGRRPPPRNDDNPPPRQRP